MVAPARIGGADLSFDPKRDRPRLVKLDFAGRPDPIVKPTLSSSVERVYHEPGSARATATSFCSSSPGKEPMQYNPSNPLIVQGDRTVLLEVDNPLHAEARDAIAPFAELEKSLEHIHTYRLTSLSLWNAAAAGMTADAMIDAAGGVQQVSVAAESRHRPSRAGEPVRPGDAPARWTAPAHWSRPTRLCSRNWPGRKGCATSWASESTRRAS